MKIRSPKESGYTLLELLFVASIISVLVALLVPQLILQRNKAVEVKAQRSLRTIGSVMTDYALNNPDRNYGDFQDLKDANILSENVTASNIIIDYSLVIKTADPGRGSGLAGFTIIAYPRPEREYRGLATFAVTEDNVVRVYRPGPGVSLNDPSTWDPIV